MYLYEFVPVCMHKSIHYVTYETAFYVIAINSPMYTVHVQYVQFHTGLKCVIKEDAL